MKARLLAASVLVLSLVIIILAGLPGSPDPEGPARAAEPDQRLAPPRTPLRAVQVLNLDCKDWDEVDQLLEAYKSAGVQVVVLRVFHNPDDGIYHFIKPQADEGVYFRSAQSPVVADMLGTFCERAHKKGLGVVAWMTTRYADYGHESETKLRAMAWDFDRKRPVPARGYSPLLPEAQERIVALFKELAAYPINGVLIQDDLVLHHLEGMNPAVQALYTQQTGKTVNPPSFFKDVRKQDGRWIVGGYSDDYQAWRRWQSRGLVDLAVRLRAAVHSRKPGIPVGINVYYEALTDPKNGMRWYAQDLSAITATNLDFYALMLYHRQMEKEMDLSRRQVFDLIVKSVKEFTGKVDIEQRIWVKLQCVDWDSGARVPAAELAELTGRLKKLGPLGLVIIPTPRSLDRDALVKIFN